MGRQRHFGEIHRRQRGTIVAVADQLGRHLAADAFLGLARGTTDVRREQHVGKANERRLELALVALRFHRKHVDGRPQNVLRFQRRCQRIDIHHRATRGIDQEAAAFHFRNAGRVHHVLRRRRFGHVQTHHIRPGQQLVQGGQLAGIAQGQLGFDVIEHHAHAHVLGHQADLGADVAIADDAQRLAAHLERIGGTLHPAALVQQGVLLGNAPHQHDDLGQHQLGHAARIGERRIEHRHPAPCRCLQRNLVGAYTEGPHGHQLLGLLQHPGGELGARTQSHEMGITDGLDQRLTFQRLRMGFDLGIAIGRERLHRRRMNAFEQHDLQFVSFERETHVVPPPQIDSQPPCHGHRPARSSCGPTRWHSACPTDHTRGHGTPTGARVAKTANVNASACHC